MAAASSSSINLLLLFSLLGLSAIGVAARPGIHFLSISYTFSSSPQNPSRFVAIEINQFEPRPFNPSSQIALDRPVFSHSIPYISSSHDDPHGSDVPRPIPFSGSFGFASLRERTKDILSVVLALLFGASCGTLTAAAMYLLFSVFASRGQMQEPLDSEDSDEESPKDAEYMKIPSSPVKQGYVGN